jgi:amino acid transporter
VAIAVLAAGGYHHHGITAAPFSPHGVPLAVLALGVTAVFGQFSGFESAATLGEEARRSTRTIPAAITWSLIGAAAIYIFFTWIVYSAYPSPAAVAADPAPLVTVAGAYLGSPVAVAVNAAGLVSAFGAQLACLNAAARLLYALGRESGGPGRFLTRTWPRYGSPAGALAVAGAASIAGLAAFGAEPTATRAATLIIQYGAYLILSAYLLTVTAALAWTWRTRRRPAPVIILSAGVAVLGYVLYRTFVPFPAAPFGWVVLAAAASAAAGAGLLLIPGRLARLRRSRLLAVATAAAHPAQRP